MKLGESENVMGWVHDMLRFENRPLTYAERKYCRRCVLSERWDEIVVKIELRI